MERSRVAALKSTFPIVSSCLIIALPTRFLPADLRIVKYRGTAHGTNEYPFLIDEDGFSVLPVTSLSLQHKVSKERISSGIPRLDAMLEGKGFYRGNTILGFRHGRDRKDEPGGSFS